MSSFGDAPPPAAVEEENEDSWSSIVKCEDGYDSEDEEMDPVEMAKYLKQVRDSKGFDVDDLDHPCGGIRPLGCIPYDALLAKVGLHCFNAYKEKSLQFKAVTKVNAQVVSFVKYFYTLEAMDPHKKNSPVTIQTCILLAAPRNNEELRLFTTSCWIKGSGEEATQWDKDVVDSFYTGLMPTWQEISPASTRTSKALHYYEVKESDVQENEWLQLFAQIAAYSEWDIHMEDYFPLEVKKVYVRIKEHVELSVNKLKCRNAIFYLVFKTRQDLKLRAVIKANGGWKTRTHVP